MFEARLLQGHVLKRVVESVKDLLTEAAWECGPAGIQLMAMDDSHVSLVTMELRADGFDLYRCDRTVTLGMSLPSLGKIFKCAGHSDIVTIRMDEEDEDTVLFTFESIEDGRKVTEFRLGLINMETRHLAIPDIEYPATVTMPSDGFQRIVRDLTQFGDTIVISVNKNRIKFTAAGELGKGRVQLEREEGTVALEVQEPVSIIYASRFLGVFARGGCLGPAVRLSLHPDQPLVVHFDVKGLGHVRYCIAPRIVQDGSQEED